MPSQTAHDGELKAVADFILSLDPTGARTARVLRNTLDQLYDGQRTGRYRWDQLHKTEKTHCGTLVEINLHREFNFGDGKLLDYRIADAEVDCKFSQTLGGWMIPPEARGQLCLVVQTKDEASPTWNMGIIRAVEDNLSKGSNRDLKTNLNELGKKSVTWLFKDATLPSNVLLQLDRKIVDEIFAQPSGQKKN
jgi:hypothetical protein